MHGLQMVEKKLGLKEHIQHNVGRTVAQMVVASPVDVAGVGKSGWNDKNGQKSPQQAQPQGAQPDPVLAIDNQGVKTHHQDEQGNIFFTGHGQSRKKGKARGLPGCQKIKGRLFISIRNKANIIVGDLAKE